MLMTDQNSIAQTPEQEEQQQTNFATSIQEQQITPPSEAEVIQQQQSAETATDRGTMPLPADKPSPNMSSVNPSLTIVNEEENAQESAPVAAQTASAESSVPVEQEDAPVQDAEEQEEQEEARPAMQSQQEAVWSTMQMYDPSLMRDLSKNAEKNMVRGGMSQEDFDNLNWIEQGQMGFGWNNAWNRSFARYNRQPLHDVRIEGYNTSIPIIDKHIAEKRNSLSDEDFAKEMATLNNALYDDRPNEPAYQRARIKYLYEELLKEPVPETLFDADGNETTVNLHLYYLVGKITGTTAGLSSSYKEYFFGSEQFRKEKVAENRARLDQERDVLVRTGMAVENHFMTHVGQYTYQFYDTEWDEMSDEQRQRYDNYVANSFNVPRSAFDEYLAGLEKKSKKLTRLEEGRINGRSDWVDPELYKKDADDRASKEAINAMRMAYMKPRQAEIDALPINGDIARLEEEIRPHQEYVVNAIADGRLRASDPDAYKKHKAEFDRLQKEIEVAKKTLEKQSTEIWERCSDEWKSGDKTLTDKDVQDAFVGLGHYVASTRNLLVEASTRRKLEDELLAANAVTITYSALPAMNDMQRMYLMGAMNDPETFYGKDFEIVMQNYGTAAPEEVAKMRPYLVALAPTDKRCYVDHLLSEFGQGFFNIPQNFMRTIALVDESLHSGTKTQDGRDPFQLRSMQATQLAQQVTELKQREWTHATMANIGLQTANSLGYMAFLSACDIVGRGVVGLAAKTAAAASVKLGTGALAKNIAGQTIAGTASKFLGRSQVTQFIPKTALAKTSTIAGKGLGVAMSGIGQVHEMEMEIVARGGDPTSPEGKFARYMTGFLWAAVEEMQLNNITKKMTGLQKMKLINSMCRAKSFAKLSGLLLADFAEQEAQEFLQDALQETMVEYGYSKSFSSAFTKGVAKGARTLFEAAGSMFLMSAFGGAGRAIANINPHVGEVEFNQAAGQAQEIAQRQDNYIQARATDAGVQLSEEQRKKAREDARAAGSTGVGFLAAVRYKMTKLQGMSQDAFVEWVRNMTGMDQATAEKINAMFAVWEEEASKDSVLFQEMHAGARQQTVSELIGQVVHGAQTRNVDGVADTQNTTGTLGRNQKIEITHNNNKNDTVDVSSTNTGVAGQVVTRVMEALRGDKTIEGKVAFAKVDAVFKKLGTYDMIQKRGGTKEFTVADYFALTEDQRKTLTSELGIRDVGVTQTTISQDGTIHADTAVSDRGRHAVFHEMGHNFSQKLREMAKAGNTKAQELVKALSIAYAPSEAQRTKEGMEWDEEAVNDMVQGMLMQRGAGDLVTNPTFIDKLFTSLDNYLWKKGWKKSHRYQMKQRDARKSAFGTFYNALLNGGIDAVPGLEDMHDVRAVQDQRLLDRADAIEASAKLEADIESHKKLVDKATDRVNTTQANVDSAKQADDAAGVTRDSAKTAYETAQKNQKKGKKKGSKGKVSKKGKKPTKAEVRIAQLKADFDAAEVAKQATEKALADAQAELTNAKKDLAEEQGKLAVQQLKKAIKDNQIKTDGGPLTEDEKKRVAELRAKKAKEARKQRRSVDTTAQQDQGQGTDQAQGQNQEASADTSTSSVTSPADNDQQENKPADTVAPAVDQNASTQSRQDRHARARYLLDGRTVSYKVDTDGAPYTVDAEKDASGHTVYKVTKHTVNDNGQLTWYVEGSVSIDEGVLSNEAYGLSVAIPVLNRLRANGEKVDVSVTQVVERDDGTYDVSLRVLQNGKIAIPALNVCLTVNPLDENAPKSANASVQSKPVQVGDISQEGQNTDTTIPPAIGTDDADGTKPVKKVRVSSKGKVSVETAGTSSSTDNAARPKKKRQRKQKKDSIIVTPAIASSNAIVTQRDIQNVNNNEAYAKSLFSVIQWLSAYAIRDTFSKIARGLPVEGGQMGCWNDFLRDTFDDRASKVGETRAMYEMAKMLYTIAFGEVHGIPSTRSSTGYEGFFIKGNGVRVSLGVMGNIDGVSFDNEEGDGKAHTHGDYRDFANELTVRIVQGIDPVIARKLRGLISDAKRMRGQGAIAQANYEILVEETINQCTRDALYNRCGVYLDEYGRVTDPENTDVADTVFAEDGEIAWPKEKQAEIVESYNRTSSVVDILGDVLDTHDATFYCAAADCPVNISFTSDSVDLDVDTVCGIFAARLASGRTSAQAAIDVVSVIDTLLSGELIEETRGNTNSVFGNGIVVQLSKDPVSGVAKIENILFTTDTAEQRNARFYNPILVLTPDVISSAIAGMYRGIMAPYSRALPPAPTESAVSTTEVQDPFFEDLSESSDRGLSAAEKTALFIARLKEMPTAELLTRRDLANRDCANYHRRYHAAKQAYTDARADMIDMMGQIYEMQKSGIPVPRDVLEMLDGYAMLARQAMDEFVATDEYRIQFGIEDQHLRQVNAVLEERGIAPVSWRSYTEGADKRAKSTKPRKQSRKAAKQDGKVETEVVSAQTEKPVEQKNAKEPVEQKETDQAKHVEDAAVDSDKDEGIQPTQENEAVDESIVETADTAQDTTQDQAPAVQTQEEEEQSTEAPAQTSDIVDTTEDTVEDTSIQEQEQEQEAFPPEPPKSIEEGTYDAFDAQVMPFDELLTFYSRLEGYSREFFDKYHRAVVDLLDGRSNVSMLRDQIATMEKDGDTSMLDLYKAQLKSLEEDLARIEAENVGLIDLWNIFIRNQILLGKVRSKIKFIASRNSKKASDLIVADGWEEYARKRAESKGTNQDVDMEDDAWGEADLDDVSAEAFITYMEKAIAALSARKKKTKSQDVSNAPTSDEFAKAYADAVARRLAQENAKRGKKELEARDRARAEQEKAQAEQAELDTQWKSRVTQVEAVMKQILEKGFAHLPSKNGETFRLDLKNNDGSALDLVTIIGMRIVDGTQPSVAIQDAARVIYSILYGNDEAANSRMPGMKMGGYRESLGVHIYGGHLEKHAKGVEKEKLRVFGVDFGRDRNDASPEADLDEAERLSRVAKAITPDEIEERISASIRAFAKKAPVVGKDNSAYVMHSIESDHMAVSLARRGIFGSADAKNALQNLVLASSLRDALHYDDARIALVTGWAITSDGKYEYDPPQVSLKEGWESATTLGDMVNADAIFAEFPALKNVQVKRDTGFAGASPLDTFIRYNPRKLDAEICFDVYNALRTEMLKHHGFDANQMVGDVSQSIMEQVDAADKVLFAIANGTPYDVAVQVAQAETQEHTDSFVDALYGNEDTEDIVFSKKMRMRSRAKTAVDFIQNNEIRQFHSVVSPLSNVIDSEEFFEKFPAARDMKVVVATDVEEGKSHAYPQYIPASEVNPEGYILVGADFLNMQDSATGTMSDTVMPLLLDAVDAGVRVENDMEPRPDDVLEQDTSKHMVVGDYGINALLNSRNEEAREIGAKWARIKASVERTYKPKSEHGHLATFMDAGGYIGAEGKTHVDAGAFKMKRDWVSKIIRNSNKEQTYKDVMDALGNYDTDAKKRLKTLRLGDIIDTGIFGEAYKDLHLVGFKSLDDIEIIPVEISPKKEATADMGGSVDTLTLGYNWNPRERQFVINTYGIYWADKKAELLRTIIHETQHVIQGIEQFDQGIDVKQMPYFIATSYSYAKYLALKDLRVLKYLDVLSRPLDESSLGDREKEQAVVFARITIAPLVSFLEDEDPHIAKFLEVINRPLEEISIKDITSSAMDAQWHIADMCVSAPEEHKEKYKKLIALLGGEIELLDPKADLIKNPESIIEGDEVTEQVAYLRDLYLYKLSAGEQEADMVMHRDYEAIRRRSPKNIDYVDSLDKGKVISGAIKDKKKQLNLVAAEQDKAAKAVEEAMENFTYQQHSIVSLLQGANILFDNQTNRFYKKDGTQVSVDDITIDYMQSTPLGRLVELAHMRGRISDDEMTIQLGCLADLARLCVSTDNAHLVWEWAGSEMFSVLRTNADKQYGTTIDFSTVCKKTEAIIKAASEVMVRRAKRVEEARAKGKQVKAGTCALTKREIIDILYQATKNYGQQTPCPECYVFARWIGVGGLLNQMDVFQTWAANLLKMDPTGSKIIEYVEDVEREMVALYDSLSPAKQEKYEDKRGLPNSPIGKNGKKFRIASLLGIAKNLSMNGSPNSKNKALDRPGYNTLVKKYKDADIVKQTIQDIEQKIVEAKKAGDKKTVKSLQSKKSRENAKLRYLFTENDPKLGIEKNKALMMESILGKERYEKYQWCQQVLVDFKDGKYVVDPNFRPVPPEILFNLEEGYKMAEEYERHWKFRNSKGAALGKAILPYKDSIVGETIKGLASGVKSIWTDSHDNVFLTQDGKMSYTDEEKEEQEKLMESAIEAVMRQNIIGGQRFQSTSDFRPEYALDYYMEFLTMQALGSSVQLYTKVIEAVHFFASVGAEVNMSLMPKDQGWKEVIDPETGSVKLDENGNPVHELIFSDISGINHTAAFREVGKYDNVQCILVGINDEHVRLAMKDNRIAFIIPYHKSGNAAIDLIAMKRILGEAFVDANFKDFSAWQNDKHLKEKTPEQQASFDLRAKVLSGGCADLSALTAEEKAMLGFSEDGTDSGKRDGITAFLRPLYDAFYVNEKDYRYHHYLKEAIAKDKVFPHEYWDTTLTFANADENGRRFCRYLEQMGMAPRFSQFKDEKGYWKLLIDRCMYNKERDENGNWTGGYTTYHEQKPINVTNASAGELAMTTAEAKQRYGEEAVYNVFDRSTLDPIATDAGQNIDWKRTKGLTEEWEYGVKPESSSGEEDDVFERDFLEELVYEAIAGRGAEQIFSESEDGEGNEETTSVDTEGEKADPKEFGAAPRVEYKPVIPGKNNAKPDIENAAKAVENGAFPAPIDQREARAAEDEAILSSKNATQGEATDAAAMHSIVSDATMLRKLNSALEHGEVIKVYRAMAIDDDGVLHPVMNSLDENGEWTSSVNIGDWEQADENPDKAIWNSKTKSWKWQLKKSNGKKLPPVDYNPYIHSSFFMLNDQFSSAYKRDDIVVIECYVPNFDLAKDPVTGDVYRAEKAAKPVGQTGWNSGTVVGQLGEALGEEAARTVMLSRHCYISRLVDGEEFAQNVQEQLGGTNITIPVNVLPGWQRRALKKAGVTLSYQKPNGGLKVSSWEDSVRQMEEEDAAYEQEMEQRAYENGSGGNVADVITEEEVSALRHSITMDGQTATRFSKSASMTGIIASGILKGEMRSKEEYETIAGLMGIKNFDLDSYMNRANNLIDRHRDKYTKEAVSTMSDMGLLEDLSNHEDKEMLDNVMAKLFADAAATGEDIGERANRAWDRVLKFGRGIKTPDMNLQDLVHTTGVDLPGAIIEIMPELFGQTVDHTPKESEKTKEEKPAPMPFAHDEDAMAAAMSISNEKHENYKRILAEAKTKAQELAQKLEAQRQERLAKYGNGSGRSNARKSKVTDSMSENGLSPTTIAAMAFAFALKSNKVDLTNDIEFACFIREWFCDAIAAQQGIPVEQVFGVGDAQNAKNIDAYRRTVVNILEKVARSLLSVEDPRLIMHIGGRIRNLASDKNVLRTALTGDIDYITAKCANILATIQRHSIRQSRKELMRDMLKMVEARAGANTRLANGDAEFVKLMVFGQRNALDAYKEAYKPNETDEKKLNALANKKAQQLTWLVSLAQKNKNVDGFEASLTEVSLDEARRRHMDQVTEITDYLHKVLQMSKDKIEEETLLYKDMLAQTGENYRRARDAASASGLMTPKEADDKLRQEAQIKLHLLATYGGTKYKMPAEIIEVHRHIQEYLDGKIRNHYTKWAERRNAWEHSRKNIVEALIASSPHNPDGSLGSGKDYRWYSSFTDIFMSAGQKLRIATHNATAEQQAIIEELLIKLSKCSQQNGALQYRFNQDLITALNNATANSATIKTPRKLLKMLEQKIPQELNDKLKTEEQPIDMTYGQALHLYSYLLQTQSYEENIKEHGRDGQLELLKTELPAEMLAFADELRSLYEQRRSMLSSVMMELDGLPMRSPDPFYSHVKVNSNAQRLAKHDVLELGWSPISSILTPRVRHTYDCDLSMDIMAAYNESSDATARAISFGVDGLVFENVFTDTEVLAALERSVGRKDATSLVDHIRETITGNEERKRQSNALQKFIGFLVNWAALITLSWNHGSLARQAVAAVTQANVLDGGYWQLGKHILNFNKHALKELVQSDGFISRYGQDKARKLLSEPFFDPTHSQVKNFYNAGMSLIGYGDMFAGLISATGFYQARMETLLKQNPDMDAKKLDEAQKMALAEAWLYVDMGQQASSPENKSQIFNTFGTASKAASQYTSAQIQQTGTEMYYFRMWKRCLVSGNKKEAMRYGKRLMTTLITNHAILPFLMYFAGRLLAKIDKTPPPDDDERLWYIIRNLVAGPAGELFLANSIIGIMHDEFISARGGKKPYASNALHASIPSIDTFLRLVSKGVATGSDIIELDTAEMQKNILGTVGAMLAPVRTYNRRVYNTTQQKKAEERAKKKAEAKAKKEASEAEKAQRQIKRKQDERDKAQRKIAKEAEARTKAAEAGAAKSPKATDDFVRSIDQLMPKTSGAKSTEPTKPREPAKAPTFSPSMTGSNRPKRSGGGKKNSASRFDSGLL